MDFGTLHCSGWRKNSAAGSRESYDSGYVSAAPGIGRRQSRSRLLELGGSYLEVPVCEDEMGEAAVSAEDEPAPEVTFFLSEQESLVSDSTDDFGVFEVLGAAQSKNTASMAATIKPADSEDSEDYFASNDDYFAPIDVQTSVFEPRRYLWSDFLARSE